MKRTCISIFSKIWLIDPIVHTNVFAKKRKLHKFATANSIFLKSTLSDIHHRKTYMYINFQQNRVSRSVKTL